MENVLTSLFTILRRRPDLILMMALVFGFFLYLDRSEDKRLFSEETDTKSLNVVIEMSHDQQEKSTEAMNNVADALRECAKADARLQQTVMNLVNVVNELRKSNEDLRGVVVRLSAMFEVTQGSQDYEKYKRTY